MTGGVRARGGGEEGAAAVHPYKIYTVVNPVRSRRALETSGFSGSFFFFIYDETRTYNKTEI